MAWSLREVVGQNLKSNLKSDTEIPSTNLVPAAVQIPDRALADLERSEYAKVAAEIGFSSPALVKEALLAHLKERNLRIYHLDQVERFLASKAPDRASIVWVALRARDRESGAWWFQNRRHNGHLVGFSGRGYEKPVPLPALYLVKEIEESLGEKAVSFFVSDYETYPQRQPDPFLAVAPRDNITDLTVIFHWDEPNFRG